MSRKTNTLCTIFRMPLLRPFVLGVEIQILQQLTGTNATIYYATSIFQLFHPNSSGTDDITLIEFPLLATGICGTVNVIATTLTMIFIDNLGRRFLLITDAILMFLPLLIITIVIVFPGSENNIYKNATIIVTFIHIRLCICI